MKTLAIASVAVLIAACSSAENVASSANDLSADDPAIDATALDRSVDPCTDFYQFSCGGFLATLPADTQYWTRYDAMQTVRDDLFGTVLDAVKASPRSDAEAKAGKLFDSCMATGGVPESVAYATPLLAQIDQHSLAENVAFLHRAGVTPFFSISGDYDDVSVGRTWTVQAYPAGWAFRTHYDDPTARQKRLDAIVQRLTAFGVADPAGTAAKAISVEERLASAWHGYSENPHPLGQKGLALATPSFHWDEYFAALGAHGDLGSFNLPALEYFEALDPVFSLPADTLNAYLKVRAIDELAQSLPPDGDARRSSCQTNVLSLMPDAVETRFLEAAGVDATVKSKATEMFTNIVAAFADRLQNEPFLDNSTRIEALNKLHSMRAAIASSKGLDDFADLTMDTSKPFLGNVIALSERSMDRAFAQLGRPVNLGHNLAPASMVNAFNVPNLNAIEIPGGILGGFYFSPAVSKVINYAEIGSVLGHEMTHGFDTNGRLYDANGVQRDWWSPSVGAAYQERAQCLIDQYSQVVVDGVADPQTGVVPAHVNGANTITENIADEGGVELAYEAAHVESRAASRNNNGFTPSQQYFVAFAQGYCEKMSPELASRMLTDVHSPGKARVNVPLANFAKFQDAFQCQAGTPMAPANRCNVW